MPGRSSSEGFSSEDDSYSDESLLPNPRCFFDITVGDVPVGRIVFELDAHVCPRTAENFRALCTGDVCNGRGRRLWYKNNVFHNVIPGFVCVGGDIENNNGTGGESIYGKYFEDENFKLSHDRAGRLSMLNFKNNTNCSQFFITMEPTPWMDGQYTVFGQVISGAETLQKIAAVGTEDGHTIKPVRIADCGQLRIV